MRPRGRASVSRWLGLALAPLAGACEPPPTANHLPRPGQTQVAASPTASRPSRVATARAAAEELLELRRSRNYDAIARRVLEPHGPDVAATLAAVDEFLSENERLVRWLRHEIDPAAARAVDQGQFGRHLDLFSELVELRDVSATETEATVVFLVDNQLPLRRCRLVWKSDGWRYDAGDGFHATLPSAFRTMAAGMRDLHARFAEPAGRAALRADPRRVLQEVAAALEPGARLLRPPASAPVP